MSKRILLITDTKFSICPIIFLCIQGDKCCSKNAAELLAYEKILEYRVTFGLQGFSTVRDFS